MRIFLVTVLLLVITASAASAATFTQSQQPFHNRYAKYLWTAKTTMPDGWQVTPDGDSQLLQLTSDTCRMRIRITYAARTLRGSLTSWVLDNFSPSSEDEFGQGQLTARHQRKDKRRVASGGLYAYLVNGFDMSTTIGADAAYRTTYFFGGKRAVFEARVQGNFDQTTNCDNANEGDLQSGVLQILESFQVR